MWFARIIGSSLPSLSSKRSQNLTSTQKKPTASDRPSSLLKGHLYTDRDCLGRCQRVKASPWVGCVHHTSRRTFSHLRPILRRLGPHARRSFNGIRLRTGTIRPLDRHLTTRPPQP
ncbi:hypothetical protein AVEN_258238-1 [Araneus ventricosus]|uniref:Uncharacterized protein n=1 Tax=Araneus ventricosus TaxID=182803 RepID=A0A4Y2N821_ARAVE|nr:hypothetical protein AVEN_258238-1 [Araneus ventricosus]